MSIIPISFLTSIKRIAMHEQNCYHKVQISYELHIWKSICVPFAAKILPRHIKCLHHHRHHLLHRHNHLLHHLHLHQLLLLLVTAHNTMLNNSMLNRTRGQFIISLQLLFATAQNTMLTQTTGQFISPPVLFQCSQHHSCSNSAQLSWSLLLHLHFWRP